MIKSSLPILCKLLGVFVLVQKVYFILLILCAYTCTASGRTNDNLRGLLTAPPGLATAGFTTKVGTQKAAKNEAMRQAASGKVSTRTHPHGRKETTIASRKTESRETTPIRETKPRASGRSTPVGKPPTGGESVRRTPASKLQSSQPRSTTARPTTPSSTRTTLVRPTTPSSTKPSSSRTSPRHAATSTLATKPSSAATKTSPKHTRPTTPTRTAGRSVSRIPTKSKIPTKTS